MWTPNPGGNPGGTPPPSQPPRRISSRSSSGGRQTSRVVRNVPNMYYNQAYDRTPAPMPSMVTASGPPSSSSSASGGGGAIPPHPAPRSLDEVDRDDSSARRSRKSKRGRVFDDPAEMIVIDYADGANVSPRATGIATSKPKPPVYRHPPPQPVSFTKRSDKVVVMPPSRQNVNFPEEHVRQQVPDNRKEDIVVSGGEMVLSSRFPVQHGHGPFFNHHIQHSVHHGDAFAATVRHVHYQSDHGFFPPPTRNASNPAHSVKHSNRSSRSSDTSSAYSGSDTMQSMHSSLENEPVDLSGLHESVVDSDEEDLADSMDSLAIRDTVRDCLEKDPADRTPEDIEVLLEFTQTLPAFCNMTLATRRALCAVMVFAVVEKAGTIVMNDGEELDSWSVIINGEVRIDRMGANANIQPIAPQYLRWGDSFGITPTMEKLYHQGVMRTCLDDCQFVCITQTDYYKILNEELTNQRRFEDDNGKTVLVTEPDTSGKVGHKVIRGTPERLLSQLIDANSTTADPSYVEDFLLTHRTFMDSSLIVIEKLLEWFIEGKHCDRVTRVLLLWVHNHFTDFEMDPRMMEYLEKFERALETKQMKGHLRMLHVTCAEKARKRTITLTRPSREEPLQFSLMGGFERGFGIFVDRVEKGSKAAEIGLKRGDQILEVNRLSFEHNMTLQKAMTTLTDSTHLQICVKSNLLVFKELLQTPENSPRTRMRKSSDLTGLRSSANEYEVTSSKKSSDDSGNTMRSTKSSSSLPIGAMSGKDKVKAILKGLIKPKSFPDPEQAPSNAIPDDWSTTNDLPEHSLKVFKADQHFRYLLVHHNTSARNVVMLALQEFGISECSTNFTLCECTVEGGFVRQKRLPDDQTNLAERIGLCSRYYIKNILSSDQLIPEDVKNELMKESSVNLLQLHAIEVAMQLMVEDFTVFRTIEPTEYIDQLFELDSKFGTPNLTKFGELVNTEMWWVITEVVSERNSNRRAKIIKQFIKIAHHCFKETQNYNTMFAISSGLAHGAVKRMRNTWEKVPQKYLKLLSEMQDVMDPTMNFRKYRNLISNSKPPFIPICPMVCKDLTFIHLGNETKVEDLINFEKLRMLAKEINSLTNMCSAPLDLFFMLERQGSDFSDAMRKMNTFNPATSTSNMHTMKRGVNSKKVKEALNAKKMYEEAQMVRRVKAYLEKMPVNSNEEELHKLSLKAEPPPGQHGPSTSTSTTSLSNQEKSKTLTAQNSTASVTSGGSKGKRGNSPTPSIGSTTSSTSHQSMTSEGRKSQSSTKFGTDSPKAVRKLMSLSEPAKKPKKPSQQKLSVSSINSEPASPGNMRKISTQSMSKLETTKISLTKESSSVTSLPGLRQGSSKTSSRKLPDKPFFASCDPQPMSSSAIVHKIPKAKLGGRTLSRERKKKDKENDGQISAV